VTPWETNIAKVREAINGPTYSEADWQARAWARAALNRLDVEHQQTLTELAEARKSLRRAAYLGRHLIQRVPEFTGVVGPGGEREDDHIRDSLLAEFDGFSRQAGNEAGNEEPLLEVRTVRRVTTHLPLANPDNPTAPVADWDDAG